MGGHHVTKRGNLGSNPLGNTIFNLTRCIMKITDVVLNDDSKLLDELISKVDGIISTMRNRPEGRGAITTKAELQGSYVVGSIRYWGTWDFPDDEDGEDDDGDYDWKVLSQESNKTLNDIIQKANMGISGNKLEYEFSEKDYIDISIRYK